LPRRHTGRIGNVRGAVRVVGKRSERKITLRASAQALKELACLIETSLELSGGASTDIALRSARSCGPDSGP